MDIAGLLLTSNAIQLFATFTFGACLILLPIHKIIIPVGILLAAGVFVSFFFMVGEVYIYSDTYRRAFFIFGDEITTILGFTLLYAVATRRDLSALATITAIFMSGGKASFILILMMLSIFFVMQRVPGERLLTIKRLLAFSIIGGMVYIACQSLSLSATNSSAFISARAIIVQGLDAIGSGSADDHEQPKIGKACNSIAKCIATQVESPLLQRYYTSLGGLWMISQGGFPGARYPGTPEKFADLMIAANPWGINDRYGITWKNWHRMGSVQNPYLAFGSGYGPFALLGLVLLFLALAYLAWGNLRNGEADPSAVFPIFFIVNIVANWTQSWLMSGSLILILLGLCTSQILMSWMRRRLEPERRKLFERFALKPIRTRTHNF